MARGLLLLKYVKSERYIDNLGFVIKKIPGNSGDFFISNQKILFYLLLGSRDVFFDIAELHGRGEFFFNSLVHG